MSEEAVAFIHDLSFDDIPTGVVHQAKRCVLDLIGVWAAGSRTQASRVICNHVAQHHAAGTLGVHIPFDGRRVSPVGAALAGATTIDSYDAHDGHEVAKGHAGVALLPAFLAFHGDNGRCHTRHILAALVVGYEIAIRAGLALHRTAHDYHSSGAWNSIGCAAVGARVLGLDSARTRHALGIAEYHGPRALMLRCIDHPTMVKDSSGWGAAAGVSAAYLAADDFTGAPAALLDEPRARDLWADLGQRWRMLELNFKTYPVCRWAQPSIEAARQILIENTIHVGEIKSIRVRTFHEATRLTVCRPASTEEAQYSLPFPLAVAIIKGNIQSEHLIGRGLEDPEVIGLSEKVRLIEDDRYNERFPMERWADVTIELESGGTLRSQPAMARGNYDNPLTDAELIDKFHLHANPILGPEMSGRMAEEILALESKGEIQPSWLRMLLRPAVRAT